MKLRHISILFFSMLLAGCSVWPRREPPQQKFFAALMQGNGTRAGQIWRDMSANDKARLQRGDWTRPQISKSQVQAQHAQQARDQTPQQNNESPVDGTNTDYRQKV